LVEKKGFEYLIRAFEAVSKRMPNARCDIIGAGVLESELRRLIAELGLGHCVRLLGPQPQEEVRRRMRQASAIAAPCVVASDGDKDGLPTVLLEAMAIGTPIISTDVTGIPEILTHEETGIAVPQRDSEALVSASLRLLEDDLLRRRLAGQARKVIEHRFDIRKNSVQLRDLFMDIVSGRRRCWCTENQVDTQNSHCIGEPGPGNFPEPSERCCGPSPSHAPGLFATGRASQ
jgi:glycosyltransferase involved in cell wall biosynthesis